MYHRLKTVIALALLALIVAGCGAPATTDTSVATSGASVATKAPAATTGASAATSGAATNSGAAATKAPAATTGAATGATAGAAATGKPIKIGLSTPLTGPSAAVGEGFVMGVTMAIEDLGGAIGGHKLELYKADNKCTPADAVTAVRSLIDENQVDVIIGSSCSGATLAALPIIQEGQVVQLSVTSSNATIYDQLGVGGNDWGFRLNLDDLIIAKTLVSYMAKQNTKNIFIIGQNNDFGRGGAKAYQDELPKGGISVAGTEFYDPGTSDFRPILTKIKQSGADSIMTFMVEADSVPFFRQAKEVGLKVKVYTRGGVTSPLFMDMTKDDPSLGEGAIGASYWTANMDPATEKHFQERWNTPPTVHRMMAYYGMKLVLADAMQRILSANGEVTRTSIRDALKTTNLKGTPIGDIQFDDHHQAYPYLTLDTIKDGKITKLDLVPAVHR